MAQRRISKIEDKLIAKAQAMRRGYLNEELACAAYERADRQRIDYQICKLPRLGAPLLAHNACERGYESRAQRSLGKKVAQEIGYSVGDIECIRKNPGAEIARHHHFAHYAQHAADHRGQAHN